MWTLIVLLVGIGGNIAPWVYILGGNKYPDYKQEEMWMLMGENVTGRKYDATPAHPVDNLKFLILYHNLFYMAGPL